MSAGTTINGSGAGLTQTGQNLQNSSGFQVKKKEEPQRAQGPIFLQTSLSGDDFKKLTADLKGLGVNLDGLLDKEGNLLPNKIEEAKSLIKTRAAQLEETKTPSLAARLYKKIIQLEPRNIGARLDLVRTLHAAADQTGKADLRDLYRREAYQEVKSMMEMVKSSRGPIFMNYPAALSAVLKAAEFNPEISQEIPRFKEFLIRQAARLHVHGENAMQAKKGPIAAFFLSEAGKIYEAMGHEESVKVLAEKLTKLSNDMGITKLSEETQKLATQGFLSPAVLKSSTLKMENLVVSHHLETNKFRLEFKEGFQKMKPFEKLTVLKELSRLGLSELVRENAKQEKDPNKKLYYQAKLDLLEGNQPAALLKMVEFKAKTENVKDPEILEMRKELRGILRQESLKSVARLRERNEALKNQRKSRVEGRFFDPRPMAQLKDRILNELELSLKSERADTLEEGLSLLKEDDKKLKEAFQKNPVIQKSWVVTLPPGLSSVTLKGGALEIDETPSTLKVTIGKEGGIVRIKKTSEGLKKVSVYYETISFPPSDREKTVSFDYGQFTPGSLQNGKDYQEFSRGTAPEGFKDLKREDHLTKHPQTLSELVGHWSRVHYQDPDFLTLFNLETQAGWEKMKTPEERRHHLLQVAESVRHRQGSYVVVGEILEELFAKDYAKAFSEITPAQKSQITLEIEKDRGTIEKDVRKSLERMKKENPVAWSQRYPKGEPTQEETKKMVEEALTTKINLKLKRLAFEKLDSLHNKGGLSDPVSDKAWKIYEDMKDPLDKFWNISDEGWDSIVDEIVTSVVTMPIAMGVGSAVRGALGATSLALRLTAQGGVRAFAARSAIFGIGAIVEGHTMEAVNAGLFTGEFHLKSAGWNAVMSTAFHRGGHLWGKMAQKIGVDGALLQAAKGIARSGVKLEEAALTLAKTSGRTLEEATLALQTIAGKNLVGRELTHFAGMMATQTSIATAMGYAHETLRGEEGPTRTFWERVGGEALRMLAFHYGTAAMNMATGGALQQREMLAQARQGVAREIYTEFQPRFKAELVKKGYSEAIAESIAKEAALDFAASQAKEFQLPIPESTQNQTTSSATNEKKETTSKTISERQIITSREQLLGEQVKRGRDIASLFGHGENEIFLKTFDRLIVEDIRWAEKNPEAQGSTEALGGRVKRYLDRAPEALRNNPEFKKAVGRLVEENLRGATPVEQNLAARSAAQGLARPAGMEIPTVAPKKEKVVYKGKLLETTDAVLEGEGTPFIISFGAKGKRSFAAEGMAPDIQFGRNENANQGQGTYYVYVLNGASVKILRNNSGKIEEISPDSGVRMGDTKYAAMRLEIRNGDILEVNGRRYTFKTPETIQSEIKTQGEIRATRNEIETLKQKIQDLKKQEKPDTEKIASLEKELAQKEAAHESQVAQVLPKVVQDIADSVFNGRFEGQEGRMEIFNGRGGVSPEARIALRDHMVKALHEAGIQVSTDNVKAVDSIIDLAITAKAHGLIDQPGGLTRDAFFKIVGELYFHKNPSIRIGQTELTHVPMVVEGTLNHFEMIMAARGETASASQKKAMFLAALLHDAGKWDPNIKTETGFTILASSPFNKTGKEIVVKSGQSLSEALKEQNINPNDVKLPFDGMTAILVHHDASSVRGRVEQLVNQGILSALEGQRVWEAIQWHGFVSSWIVKNSLGGLGIKSHTFNEKFDPALKEFLEAYQEVSKKLDQKGTAADLQSLMKEGLFAADVESLREIFKKLPPFVQALMLGDHQGQIDISKYMTILSGVPANKEASLHDLFFGTSLENSVLGVVRKHSLEQQILSPTQGEAAATAFQRAEGWLSAPADQPGLAHAILKDPVLKSKYEAWRDDQSNTQADKSVHEWLKTLKVKSADGKTTEEFQKIQGLVDKEFYQFYTLNPENPLAWRKEGKREAPPQRLPRFTNDQWLKLAESLGLLTMDFAQRRKAQELVDQRGKENPFHYDDALRTLSILGKLLGEQSGLIVGDRYSLRQKLLMEVLKGDWTVEKAETLAKDFRAGKSRFARDPEGLDYHIENVSVPSSRQTPQRENLPLAAASGDSGNIGKPKSLSTSPGVLEAGGRSYPGAVIIPHQTPDVQRHPQTRFRNLTLKGDIDFQKGEIHLKQEGRTEPIVYKFDPKNPPEFVKKWDHKVQRFDIIDKPVGL